MVRQIPLRGFALKPTFLLLLKFQHLSIFKVPQLQIKEKKTLLGMIV